MGGDIWSQQDKYRMMMLDVFRRSSLVMSLVLVTVAVLASLNIIHPAPMYDSNVTVGIIVLVLCFGLWGQLTHERGPRVKYYFAYPYHIICALFTIYITGFLSPLTLCWVTLMVVVSTQFSIKAQLWSYAVLVGTGVYAFIFSNDYSVQNIMQYLLVIIVVGALSGFMVGIQKVQRTQQTDLVRVKAEGSHSQNQFMTLLNSLNEAILSINNRGIIQFYNAATLNLLDTNQNLTGRSVNQVFMIYNEEGKPVKLFQSLHDGAPSQRRDDLKHTFPDGEQINLDISSSVIRDQHNKIQGYMLVVRDITLDKSLDEERDEFISVVSHELRTPVTIAEGTISNVQLLLEKGATPRVVGDALKTAHEQILFLASMVNDLGTLSRAERDADNTFERVNVLQLAQELHQKYQVRANKKRLLFDADFSPQLGYVFTSRLYLEEILQNFLTNAIKYTPKGSVTFIVKKHEDSVIFTIKDSGIGISKKDQERIFQKFFRSEDYRTRETSGTGLGLYIVRKLADKIGATISLESRLNHGSSFSFSLPSTTAIDSEPKKE